MEKLVTDFEELMTPLDTLITMQFQRVVKSKVKNLYHKYKEEIVGTSGQQEIESLLKESINRILPLLATNYMKKIENYYTVDGLVFYIYSCFRTLCFKELKIEEDDASTFLGTPATF